MHLTPKDGETLMDLVRRMESWERLLGDPRLYQMLGNARRTRDELAARILSNAGSRESYNAYQREYMREKRLRARQKPRV